MEKLTISAISKPLIVGAWFLILGSFPFLFPTRGIPYWASIVFFFFALIIIIQIKKFELSMNQILMKNFITGQTTIIERQEIEYIAVADMPASLASKLGLMKRGRMATIMTKNKIKINIPTSSTGHQKFYLAEEFLRNNYAEFFRN
ncbi:MAG TPA: hypothetical protein VFJ43_13050 [Bacteroidia bacterium]|nr:hypothetical protein [Bacteroidia bacterium]